MKTLKSLETFYAFKCLLNRKIPLLNPFTQPYLCLALCMSLAGCSSYSSGFDCPIGEGLHCASLSEVNQKIDQGALPLGFPAQNPSPSCTTCQKVYWRGDLMPSQTLSHQKGR